MINLRNIVRLSMAKMRSQKRRSILVVVVSGILFGFLLAMAIIWKAGVQSVVSFSDGVSGGSQLVIASKIDISDAQLALDPVLIQKAEQAFQTDIASKKAYAASIGYAYDSSAETPVVISDTDAQGQITKRLNPASLVARNLLQQAHQENGVGLPEIQSLTAHYATTNIFEAKGLRTVDGSLQSNPAQPSEVTALLSPQGQLPYILDQAVLAPYILRQSSPSGDVPIVIPIAAAQTELGLKPLSADASTQDRLARLQEIKDRAGSIQFSLCYRNDIDQQHLTHAIQKTRDNGVLYDEPAVFCGDVKIAEDNRTLAQKTQDQRRLLFDRHFGLVAEPQHQLVHYQVVGVVPDSQIGMPKDNVAQFMLSLLTPPGFGFAAITSQAYQTAVVQDMQLHTVFTTSDSTAETITMRNYIIQFVGRDDAARFLRDHQCTPDQHCDTAYRFTQFGSNSIQLSEVASGLQTAFWYAAGVLAFVAVVILGGTFSKLIVDNRRETAVFRAFGATRMDIVAIYTGYAVLMALLTALFAVGLAYSIASGAQLLWAGQLQSELQLTYGFAQNVSTQLVMWAPFEVFIVAALILLAGVLSMLLALTGSMQREIMGDLKEAG